MSDETRPLNQPPAQPAPESAALPPYQQQYAPAYAAAPATRRGRSGLLLGGLALGIALVAGTGGFALGHVTADDGPDGPGRMFHQRPNAGEGGPGGFGQGEGQLPAP